MKSSTLPLHLLCLCALAAVLGFVAGDKPLFPNQAANADELRAEIEARCAEWRKAMLEDHDLVKVASFYADDGIIIDARGLRVSGREAIDAYWSQIPDVSDWTLTTYFVDGRDDLIVQRGRSDLTMKIGDQERTSTVEFTHLWQRQKDGALRIVVDGYWQKRGSRE